MTHLYFECRGVGKPVAMCVRAKDAARGREFVLSRSSPTCVITEITQQQYRTIRRQQQREWAKQDRASTGGAS